MDSELSAKQLSLLNLDSLFSLLMGLKLDVCEPFDPLSFLVFGNEYFSDRLEPFILKEFPYIFLLALKGQVLHENGSVLFFFVFSVFLTAHCYNSSSVNVHLLPLQNVKNFVPCLLVIELNIGSFPFIFLLAPNFFDGFPEVLWNE